MINSVTFMTTNGSEARPPRPTATASKPKDDQSDSSSADDYNLARASASDNSSNWSAKDSIDQEIKEMRR